MTIVTEAVTLLSKFQGARGRESWTLTLDAHPGIAPVWVGYGVMGRDPGPFWTVPRDTLTVSQGSSGQVTPGAAIYLHAPLNTSFSFTETAR